MGETIKHKSLIISNDIQELNRVVPFLEELQEEWDIPAGLISPINLALEEALSNIIFYGIDSQSQDEITLEFHSEPGALTIILIDEGKPYDPTLRSEPDLELPAEIRPIGGLGIFLIRKMMDEVSYERINLQNRLTLVKKWDTSKNQ